MADREQQPSRAEQRMLAVAKLKRAASLPRMKDGRRPPMHVEAMSEGEKAVSEGEKEQSEEEKKEGSESPPLEEAQTEALETEADADVEERTVSPGPSARTKRRSRSRSRSRTSRDFKGKARATQSPTPSPLNPGDSSQDEGPSGSSPLAIPVLPQLLSPIPHFAAMNSRLLLPTAGSPEPSFFHSPTSPSTPIPLPTLEALQKGLFRSNSAGSTAAGRRMAMHKLTGGTETYDPSPSPTPPPLPGKLGRNNTVSGGERTAARQLMLSRLGGRITKEADPEQVSGGEDRSAPSPTPKRRRRRSRRGSQSAGSGPAVSDSEFISTSPNTPVVPPTPLPPSRLDNYADLRAQSTTPNQASSSRNHSNERLAKSPPTVTTPQPDAGHEKHELTRRRSVLVEEEDEEEQYPTQPPRHNGLPGTPPSRFPHIAAVRAPHASDAPSSTSTDSANASPSAVGVPVFLSQRAPSRNEMFPSSPFTTPLKEKPISDDDDEQIMYPADTYRPRTPYGNAVESYDREISWVADPVPDIRMVIDDDDDDEEEGEQEQEREQEQEQEQEQDDVEQDESEDQYEAQEYEEPPLSATSSTGFSPPEVYDDTSPRVSSSTKSLIIDSEASPENNLSYIPPSPSSIAALSHTASIARASDGSMSPQAYPTRLSIASRIHSPMNGETSDWDDRFIGNESSSKRAETASPSLWEKVKGAVARSSSGRRSRTNSIVTRERRDHTDSSISRESGVSLTSMKTDKGDIITQFAQQQTQQPLMQSPSASASILSLAPHAPPRGGASPIPPPSSTDLSKYQDAKLFPFPGMKKLEEERNRAKNLLTASSSTPDVTMFSMVDDNQPPLSANSFGSATPQTPETSRERKLSHQASDTRLTTKYISDATVVGTAPSSSTDYFNPPPVAQRGGSLNLKLPTTLPGVKQWLNKRKMLPSQGSSPSSSVSNSPPVLLETHISPSTNKKPSLSDLLRRKEAELATDWEELGSAATSTSGETLLEKKLTTPEQSPVPDSNGHGRNGISSGGGSALKMDHITDTEKTPKAKKVLPLNVGLGAERAYLTFEDAPSNQPSASDPQLSATPDPSSSLSDYPAHSTSESSSTSSDYSLGGAPQGPQVLERLDESLARGSRNGTWSAAIDDPPRKLILSSPVLQVVNPNTVKDRFLFLFNDLLVIAKPVIQDQDNLMDTYKPSPPDRKFVVKSVVQVRHLRFCADRTEAQPRTSSSISSSRSPLIKGFIQLFSSDPDFAIDNLISKGNLPDDSTFLGQLLFKTLDLDRARLGEYLSRRSSKSILKAYLDSFGFLGLRIDKALRVFLHSINVQGKSSALDYLLDAFASRWYDANATAVAYDKDLAIRLVRAMVQMNELFHGGIAQEPGPTGYPRRNITNRDFLEAFRRYDIRHLVSDELLADVYDSIRHERLCQARNDPSGSAADLSIIIKRAVPARLTYRVQSEPVILRLPHVDPHLTIQLYGQDLVFDPPVLTFAKSSEASFRVMGTSLGPKTMIMCRSGPNALKYSGLSLSNSLVVERAFMRNTFQLAFTNHTETKRKYMFSVDDPLIRHQWVVSLKRHIDNAAYSPEGPPGYSKFLRAAEIVAFKTLQETLIGPSSAIQSALNRLNGSLRVGQNGNSSFRSEQKFGASYASQTGPLHIRSKSRSKVYRYGAGKNELDLSFNSASNKLSEADDIERPDGISGSHEQETSPGVEGLLWSSRDLEIHCRQNSSIPLVLAYLQVGSQEQGLSSKS